MADRYMELLESIQSMTSAENRSLASQGVTDEEARLHLIDIDWNTRTVTLPSAYSSYISVLTDHRAATLYFSADRYYDDVDLTKLTISIEFVNANGEGRIYPIVDYDLSDPEKIMFGWKIGYEATKYVGNIQFMVHVFSVDPATHKYTYSLNTLPCTARILKTIELDDVLGVQDTYGMEATEVEDLFGRLRALEEKAVTWYDLVGTPDGTDSTDVYPSYDNNTDNGSDSYNPDSSYFD